MLPAACHNDELTRERALYLFGTKGVSAEEDSFIPQSGDTVTEDNTIAEDTAPGTDVRPGGDTVGEEFIEFVAVVEGFGMNGELVGGVTVEVFDNSSGMATGLTAISNEAGQVVFDKLEKDLLCGFKMTREDFKDTFVWNVMVSEYEEHTLWIMPDSVYNLALGLAGIDAKAGKGVVLGAVYWFGEGGEEAVGCAKVTSEPPAPDIRYTDADTGLPTTLDKQACTSNGDNGAGQFLAANLPSGLITLSAVDSGSKLLGSTKLFSFADSVTIGNIYVDLYVFPENPTPETCNCTQ